MIAEPFDRTKHVYHNAAFSEIIKDALRFFNGTPVYSLALLERFLGSGVYALYYTGDHPIYARYKQLNRLVYNFPIYVGKAVPAGWRQSRTIEAGSASSARLYRRLIEHSNSIALTSNLQSTDFYYRFILFEQEESAMIGSIEAALIKINQPLWNSCLDGFGNHDPGKGRYEQARSDWDVIHPGRIWAERLNGIPNCESDLLAKIAGYFKHLGKSEL